MAHPRTILNPKPNLNQQNRNAKEDPQKTKSKKKTNVGIWHNARIRTEFNLYKFSLRIYLWFATCVVTLKRGELYTNWKC